MALERLRLGSVTLPNQVLLSPMAGFTDVAFRALCRRHGAGLVSTEMVAALSLEREGSATLRRMVTTAEERPVKIQIVGNEPDAVAAAARAAHDGCEVLGLNMGCPAHQVAKTGCGAALLDQPELAQELVRAVKGASSRPLLVKMRAGTGRVMDCAAFARRLEDAGADGILFHARTAAQGYSGLADWGLIRQVKDAVSIPVVGNGDLRDGPGAARALRESGCDGVAVGRASLGDPRVFARIVAFLERGEVLPPASPEERLDDFRLYVERAVAAGLPMTYLLPHAQRFSKGIVGSARLRAELSEARSGAELLARFDAHVRGLPRAAEARSAAVA